MQHLISHLTPHYLHRPPAPAVSPLLSPSHSSSVPAILVARYLLALTAADQPTAQVPLLIVVSHTRRHSVSSDRRPSLLVNLTLPSWYFAPSAMSTASIADAPTHLRRATSAAHRTPPLRPALHTTNRWATPTRQPASPVASSTPAPSALPRRARPPHQRGVIQPLRQASPTRRTRQPACALLLTHLDSRHHQAPARLSRQPRPLCTPLTRRRSQPPMHPQP